MSKKLNRRQCQIIAHQGSSFQAPENSIPAFTIAGQNDFYGIESDVQTTKDRHFLMFHDETLDRQTAGRGFIKHKNYDEIKDYRLTGGQKIEEYPNEPIPKLEDYLRICKEYGKVPIIEIKEVIEPEDLIKIVELTKAYGLYEVSTIISFNLFYLLFIREHYDITIQYLLNRIEKEHELLDICEYYGFDLDIEHKALTKRFIDACHDRGILVNAWTVDAFDRAQELIDLGIDFLTTNHLL